MPFFTHKLQPDEKNYFVSSDQKTVDLWSFKAYTRAKGANSTETTLVRGKIMSNDNVNAEEFDENIFDDEDEEVETASPAAPEKKPRKPRTPRQILYCCAGVVTLDKDVENVGKQGETVVIQEALGVTMPHRGEAFDEKAGRAEAVDGFKTQWNVEPSSVIGPLYQRRGTPITRRKRDSISLKVGAKYGLSGKQGTAVYDNWNVIVNFTNNEEICLILYESQINKDKKQQRPNSKYVKKSALQNLTDRI